MSKLFSELLVKRQLNKVAPDNPCDVCGEPAGYYSPVYYIHVCSVKCYKIFEKRVMAEIGGLSIGKLKGERLNGSN